jgi:hypothetical protein
MAKISKSYESDIDLTTFAVEGEVTADDIWEQTFAFLSAKPSKLALWDFTAGTIQLISSQELKEIARRGGNILDKIDDGKVAIVAPKDIDYGITRVFQVFSEMEHFPLEVATFREKNDAREWLLTAPGPRNP